MPFWFCISPKFLSGRKDLLYGFCPLLVIFLLSRFLVFLLSFPLPLSTVYILLVSFKCPSRLDFIGTFSHSLSLYPAIRNLVLSFFFRLHLYGSWMAPSCLFWTKSYLNDLHVNIKPQSQSPITWSVASSRLIVLLLSFIGLNVSLASSSATTFHGLIVHYSNQEFLY